jgi:L-threonylcarbamoyladenylate synthase
MDKQVLSRAISALKSGGIIVYPTDTLYGLGADVFNDNAVKKVFKVKNRPFNLPISVAVSCIEDLEKIAIVDDKAKKIIDKFLPGKLTLILKKKKTISNIVTGGLENIAIRIPDNIVALELLSTFGPLTCTSANIHGKETPTVISDIRMQFKKSGISLYINHGKLRGKPSTIVDLADKKPTLIRQGAIEFEDILDAIENG